VAVTYNSVSTGSIATSAVLPSLTISHAMAAGTNTFLIAGVTWESSVGNSVAPDVEIISSVTYGGVSMTFLSSVSQGASTTEIYYYLAPSGTANVIVTWDDFDFPGSSCLVTAGVAILGFANVNQTTPIAQSGSATGLNSPITKALTTASASNMLVDFTASVLATTIAVSGSNTERANFTYGTLGSIARQGASTLQATGGSDTMSWTEGTTTRDWSTFLVELGAVASASVSGCSMSQLLFCS
jgi:hypothetical protein